MSYPIVSHLSHYRIVLVVSHHKEIQEGNRPSRKFKILEVSNICFYKIMLYFLNKNYDKAKL